MIQEHKSLTYKGKAVFEKLTITLPKRTVKPFHETEACFVFVNKGNFSVRTPDQFISFKKGKGLLAKCFNFFVETTKMQRTSGDKMEVIGVLFYPSMVEEIFHLDLSQSKHTVNYNVKQIQIDKLLHSFMESIDVLLDHPELADEAMVKTKLMEFILLISKTQNATSHLDFLSAMFRKNATEFRDTVTNNLYANLSVEEFAQLCSLSISSFKRKFTEVYNESPKKYVAKMKLIRASKLLATGNLRISDIAYQCGYETISTFNRSFKAHFGKSPSEYRMNQVA